ncbi:serine/threonine kinase SAD-1 [Microplitis mediator]|uniref:serine/threonine kinase SAD-1 n=1 Tax=Microplitis mediator TaxID=375433 RepID=UPI00255318C5|nr:serine/threonine kinase SAD-1 [Microplitis mediator]XP_057329711.1 serine/threonine kinase SAD-1 [Microplitis mediator]XP_057329712.1 serine/threonine kinase SAD-1 [Microplitis mediator]
MHRRLGHSNYDGKIAGLYDLEETLGRGHFAVVKLARHVFTGEKVAVKVIDKSKLDEVSRAHLFQEVRCMKLVQHPNVVRLYEVIDTQTKLYLILELGDGGDLYDYIMRHDSGLSEEVARTYFRQIVRAISYCHRLHVVHRDLKPENVVFFEKIGTVKLTDFGFSNRFCPGQKLETSCGSLAYSAPEILLGDSYDAPAVDVWSLGVILYMLVCGQAPFQEANDSETLTMIMDCKYSIPSHVSDECKRLIAKMLVRAPEGRATLEQIASDPWLGIETDDPVDALPLVSREQVSEEHHNLIITKMVNGNIATKEDILEALDKNEYNHITATYFLLAERKLRAHRQEQVQKDRTELDVTTRRHNDLSVNDLRVDPNSMGSMNQSLLSVPRTPGDVPQNSRTRKCSIVQEEEDEDDVSSCSGRDEHGSNSALSSFNRRGSRSEGKLSHVLQERLAQLPEKHAVLKQPLRQNIQTQEIKPKDSASPSHTFTVVKVQQDPSYPADEITTEENMNNRLPSTKGLTSTICSSSTIITAPTSTETITAVSGFNKKPIYSNYERPKSAAESLKTPVLVPNNKWKMGSQHRTANDSNTAVSPSKNLKNFGIGKLETITTTILTESSTAPSPIRSPKTFTSDSNLQPKYKTMPLTGGPAVSSIGEIQSEKLALKEILEDGDALESTADTGGGDNSSKSRVIRRTGYEQKRSKFHKTRTTSCSSSDASDDDSEGRKKRAHKLGATSGKPLPSRRDSHDDSSDSQDPGGSGGSGARGGLGNGDSVQNDTASSNTRNDGNENSTSTTTTTTTGTSGGKVQRCTESQAMTFGRRHRAGRRRAGETRLRESQSLNRITEVQEAELPNACHALYRNTTVITSTCNSTSTLSIINSKSIVGTATTTTAIITMSNSINSLATSTTTTTSTTATSTSTTTNTSYITTTTATTVQRAKGFGARLLQSWNLSAKGLITQAVDSKSPGYNSKDNKKNNQEDKFVEIIREDKNKREQNGGILNFDRENSKSSSINSTRGSGVGGSNDCKNRKIRLLTRYFAVHKKLCVPLPGFLGKGKLYKARSCGNISRERVSPSSPKSVLLCATSEDKWRERHQWNETKEHHQQNHQQQQQQQLLLQQHRGSDGDINQNLGLAQFVQDSVMNNGCVGLPAICHIHLGDPSKCCSLC